MSGCDIRLVFTLPPRDSTLQYKRCGHLCNNIPCIITLHQPQYFYPREIQFPNLKQLVFQRSKSSIATFKKYWSITHMHHSYPSFISFEDLMDNWLKYELRFDPVIHNTKVFPAGSLCWFKIKSINRSCWYLILTLIVLIKNILLFLPT